MIIGLTGTKASGKGVLSEFLIQKGFTYSSLSDRVREEAEKKLSSYTIKDLQEIGKRLRQEFGGAVLVKKTLEKFSNEENLIVDGIRNTDEIKELKKQNAIILGVDAPQEVRYKRLMERNRLTDPKNWEEFLIADKKDRGIEGETSGQQVDECLKQADYLIYNDSTVENYENKVKNFFEKITSKRQQVIFGITGTLGSGKGTVSEILKQRGFEHYSVREFITDLLTKQGKEHSRDNIVSLANQLRKENSPSYIIEELYKKAKESNKNAIIESIRCPGEIDSLKQKGEFYLLAVDANPLERYRRIVERASSTDKKTFEEFMSDEQREMVSTDPTKQNISVCVKRADFKIQNDSTVEDLEENVQEILDKVIKKLQHKKPTWDEYFMEIMHAVSRRATCDRGRTGCVIVKDKQILVTGYVGAPKGLPDCDEVGHQLEKTIHEDGIARDHCVRTTHAEQNAICQAARLGVSIEGATIYCKLEPCPVCAKMLINSGIKRVVCEIRYQSGAQTLLEQAGIKVEVLKEEIEKY